MLSEKIKIMLDINSFHNILVVGYGVSGKSVHEFLKNKGFRVFVYDDKDEKAPDKISDINWSEIDLVIKSPAIPFMDHNCHPVIKQANDHEIPVISTFDVFRIYHPGAKIIAITGTNGKSTTTALTYHILKKAGFSVEMGGNVGIPYFDLPKAEWYVFEMSSYELASSKYLDFEIACILNIEPDHMEIHGSFENYIEAKHLALDHAKLRLISYEDHYSMSKYAKQEKVITISTEYEPKADIYVCENAILNRVSNRVAIDLSGILNLRGKHNYQNIEFAYAICKNLGLQSREIINHVMSFTPLPHRLNTVRKIGDVLFVNDSKATNPGSAARALATFFGYKIYWLVGGRSKKTDPMIYIKDHLSGVQKVYLFGESMDEFEKTFDGIKKTIRCQTMENALKAAYKDAAMEKGPSVVLLSPMCASFDQYKSFEHRGEEFVKMVESLK